jgi:arylsulfatase A-like enzyme
VEETRTAELSAETFLQQTEQNDSQPWALVVATYSPHQPYTVQPKNPFPYPAFRPSLSFNEQDLSDKQPEVARKAQGYDRRKPDQYQAIYDGQMRELQAVDEMVGALMDDLETLGERRDTLAIFISDNGFLHKDHRVYFKLWPYLDAVSVPLYASWPAHMTGGTTESALVANIDIAPTIFEATGISPGYPVDGNSLLTNPGHEWLLMELPSTISRVAAWYAYFDGERHYIEWSKGGTSESSGGGGLGSGLGGGGGSIPFIEDYDLTADPGELEASNTPDPAMTQLLRAAKTCAGASCP